MTREEATIFNASESIKHLTVLSTEGGLAGLHVILYKNIAFIGFYLYCEFSVAVFRIKQSFHSIHPNIYPSLHSSI